LPSPHEMDKASGSAAKGASAERAVPCGDPWTDGMPRSFANWSSRKKGSGWLRRWAEFEIAGWARRREEIFGRLTRLWGRGDRWMADALLFRRRRVRLGTDGEGDGEAERVSRGFADAAGARDAIDSFSAKAKEGS